MRRYRFVGVCLLALVACAPALGGADDSQSAHAKTELKALRRKIGHVRDQIASGNRRRGKLADALDAAADKISAARRRLDRLDQAIAGHKRRIVQLKAARDEQRAHLDAALARLRKQVRAAYASGRINRMRLLLAGGSPEKIGRMLMYYRYFARAQTRQVNHLDAALAKLAARQRALEDEQAALAKQHAARANVVDRLRAGRKAEQAAIAALDKRLASEKDSLEAMRADQARVEKLLSSVQKQLSTLPPVSSNTPFSKLKGRLNPPLAGPLIARFGQSKAGGPLRWQGQWRAAAPGTPVRAVAAGRVVYVGYMKRYGLIVILDDGHDYYTLYGHAQSSYVNVGAAVRAGQPIATAGHSGGHARSGAYFEIRHGSTPVNPAAWLAN